MIGPEARPPVIRRGERRPVPIAASAVVICGDPCCRRDVTDHLPAALMRALPCKETDMPPQPAPADSEGLETGFRPAPPNWWDVDVEDQADLDLAGTRRLLAEMTKERDELAASHRELMGHFDAMTRDRDRMRELARQACDVADGIPWSPAAKRLAEIRQEVGL